MYGWRARIGYVEPCPVEGPAINFYQIAPPGVTLVTTALSVGEISVHNLTESDKALARAVKDLSDDDVDYIVIAGEPFCWLSGPGGDVALQKRLQQHTQVPVMPNVMAAMAALKHLSIRRVAVASPYTVIGPDGKDVFDKYKHFIESCGIEVALMKSMSVKSNREIARLPLYASYQFAREVFQEAKGADGLFIPCARWGATENIARIEQDLGVPVVTIVQSWIWKAFTDLGIKDPITGFGRLLASR